MRTKSTRTMLMNLKIVYQTWPIPKKSSTSRIMSRQSKSKAKTKKVVTTSRLNRKQSKLITI